MLKLMKMRTKDGKWIIEDQDIGLAFDSSYDAWMYVFIMKEIRPKLPAQPRSTYPVLSLVPKTTKKKVKWVVCND
jgi:hypothetical protein